MHYETDEHDDREFHARHVILWKFVFVNTVEILGAV